MHAALQRYVAFMVWYCGVCYRPEVLHEDMWVPVVFGVGRNKETNPVSATSDIWELSVAQPDHTKHVEVACWCCPN